MVKLGLDPGHGMGNRKSGVYDPGGQGGGLDEAVAARRICEAIEKELKSQGMFVWMSRHDEKTNTPLGTRDDRAKAAGCTHFLVIHLNDSDNLSATGTETLYRDSVDMAFATNVQHMALAAFGLRDRGVKSESSGQHTRLSVFDFDGPCCLLEIGFVSHKADRAAILDATRVANFAKMVAGYVRAHGGGDTVAIQEPATVDEAGAVTMKMPEEWS